MHKISHFILSASLLTLILAGSASADLIGLWRLNDGSGETVTDSSEYGHDATIDPPNEAMVSWSSEGHDGGALDFTALFAGHSFVEAPLPAGLLNMSSATYALWMKVPAAHQEWGVIIDLVGEVTDFSLEAADTGSLFSYRPNWFGADGMPVNDNQWHHVAVTFGSSGVTMYLDGEQVASDGGTTDESILSVRLGGPREYNQVWASYTGLMDDVAVFNETLDADAVADLFLNGLDTSVNASDPRPADGESDVSHDVVLDWEPVASAVNRDVFLGTDFEDVNAATVDNPLGTAVSAAQNANSYAPANALDFGQTYYWRVDEVNGAPDFAIIHGNVWSFTVEPFSVPVTNVTTTASSSFGLSPAENTVNGSGLAGDLHGTSAADMWISGGVPATIEYSFDRAYKLHELWIWNSNQSIEGFVGFGAKDVVIEHSLDGENWTVLDGVGPLAQAPGAAGYAHNNTIDFGGATARHVRVTINSVQGFSPQASLSEVRFYAIPTLATRPSPDDGATGVAPDVTLSWGRDGRDAGQHEVYVGADGTNLMLAGTVTESSFDTRPLDLQLSQSYTWRVDEVNDAMDPSTWTGTSWGFTTTDSIVVDDMETYRDEEFFEIWATWIDGFDDSANNGAVVGASPNIGDFAPESGIVNGGNNSLPIWFDNGAAPVSEATRTFGQTQDWTQGSAATLVLYFNRGVDNTGNGRLYVKVNDTKIMYPGDDSALPPAWDVWTQWNIALTTLGTDLSRVGSLTIGIEGAAAEGVFYVDDIGLYRNAPAASSQQIVTWFEAESGTVTPPMKQFIGDPKASGEAHIGTEDLIGDQNTTPPTDGVATYSFDVPEDGVYRLAFRVLIAGDNDSFWVRISGMTTNTINDPSGWVRFNGIQPGDTWHWDEVHSDDDGQQVVEFTLAAGTHTLEIAQREDGTIVDAIAVVR